MLLICVATAIEAELLRRHLDDTDRDTVADGPVALLETGIGPVSAAYAVTLFLARNDVSGVIVCGIGGAYPGSGLEPTDVVCAETETFGDLGVETPERFLDFETLGFGPSVFPLDLFPVQRRVPFVTVATCTGTDERARSLEARTRGAVESMEGAAVAQVASAMGLPCGEVRGISNMVGMRDRASWRVEDAARAAQRELLAWLDAGP